MVGEEGVPIDVKKLTFVGRRGVVDQIVGECGFEAEEAGKPGLDGVAGAVS